jgi:hypothetical protein
MEPERGDEGFVEERLDSSGLSRNADAARVGRRRW